MTDSYYVGQSGHASPGPHVTATLSDRLRFVASRGQVQAVKDLLLAGAGFQPDKDGRTALHFAAQEGHAEICRLLAAHGCDVNMQDKMGYTALLRAASQGVKDTVQVLLDSGCDTDLQDEHGNAAIHESCWNGFSQTAELLVKYNCNVFLTNKAGFTALHLAAQNGHNECSRVVLYAGCNPDLKNNYGDTALHTTARYGHAGVARILISARCKLSEQNKNGDTALHIAAALKRRKIAKILVEAGIDTELLNKQNEKAVDVARRKEHPEIMLIITSYSRPRPPSAHRYNVTFNDTANLEDKVDICQENEENETPLKQESKTNKREKERRFFFFKKKKNKEKTPTTQAVGQTKTEQVHTGQRKPAVHGFFSQYVPRDGTQLYRDLAGNIKQGPIGYAPVCQCGPSLRRLENSITDTRESLHSRIDASHHILSQRIHTLDMKTQQKAHDTEVMVLEKFNNERNACQTRISERLQEERLETQTMLDQTSAGMKDELEYWLNDKLASYGHCLDHHHDDTALPPRNLFFDFPAMGRLVRSRSDETLSASDCSGKFRKKDFYASRQAAMQQIRGWDVPTAESFSNKEKIRRRERNNNNIISNNNNKIVTHAQVHFREPESIRDGVNTPDNLNPAPTLHTAIHNTDKTVSMNRSVYLPRKHSTHLSPHRDYVNSPGSHPRVTFSNDQQKPQMQKLQQHSGFSSPPPISPRNIPDAIHLGRQSLRSSTHRVSPEPTSIVQHRTTSTPRHSKQTQQNLYEGSSPNAYFKSSELEDSRIPSLIGQEEQTFSENGRQQNVDAHIIRGQDRSSFHYDRQRTSSADSLLNEDSHVSYFRDKARCRSVENTLDDFDSQNIDIYNSGYVTDSALRSSSSGINPRSAWSHHSTRGTHSASPSSRSTYRYRLPETSTSPDHALVENFEYFSQNNKSIQSKQISSHAQSPTNVRIYFNKTPDQERPAMFSKFNDASRELVHSKPLHTSSYGHNGRLDTLEHGGCAFGKQNPINYPERSDSASKSDGLTSSKGHSVHFTSQGKECLQHESLVPASKVVPPTNFVSGNKEDSTCSSNQDSGYGSRNHGGDLRRNGDTSGETPSSSFSTERSGCNTPSNTDSPLISQGEFSNMTARTCINSSYPPSLHDNEHQLSSNMLFNKSSRGVPVSLRMDQGQRGINSNRAGFAFRENIASNKTSTVPFGNQSSKYFNTEPLESLHGSTFYNKPSYPLSHDPFSKPDLQQKLNDSEINDNRSSYIFTDNNMNPLSAEKIPQADKTKNKRTYERQGLLAHDERPSHQQNSLTNPSSFGSNKLPTSAQPHNEQTSSHTLSQYNGTKSLKQTHPNTVNNYTNKLNTVLVTASKNQQENMISQTDVQAHVEGWYQRKLMEAAKRLRQNYSYNQHNTNQHYSNREQNYQGGLDPDRDKSDFAGHFHRSDQTHAVSSYDRSRNLNPAENYSSQNTSQFGPSSWSHQRPQQTPTYDDSQGQNMSYNTRGHHSESEDITSHHINGNSRVLTMSERSFLSNNYSQHQQPLNQVYDLKAVNSSSSRYPPHMQAMAQNRIFYDPVQGSDV